VRASWFCGVTSSGSGSTIDTNATGATDAAAADADTTTAAAAAEPALPTLSLVGSARGVRLNEGVFLKEVFLELYGTGLHSSTLQLTLSRFCH